MEVKKWLVVFELDNQIQTCGDCPILSTECLPADYNDKANTHDFCRLKSQVRNIIPPLPAPLKRGICSDCDFKEGCPDESDDLTYCTMFERPQIKRKLEGKEF